MKYNLDSKKSTYSTMKINLNENAFTNEDDFWTNWEAFRTFVSLVIEKHIVNKEKYKSIAIWGAGRCNDLDLSFFCNNFEEVNLFDIKTEEVTKGVEDQNLIPDHLNKIKIHESFDFVDVEDDFYSKLEDMLKNKDLIKNVSKFVRKQANRLNYENAMGCFEKQFDVSISLGVHSQLFTRAMLLMEKYCDNYNRDELIKLNDEVGYLYKMGVKIYNEFLYETVVTGGIVYVGFDLIEFSKMRNTDKLIVNFRKLLEDRKILEYLHLYISEGGVMGSYDGYIDFLKYYWEDRLEKTPTNFTIWDYFSFQSYFFICFGIIK